MMGNGPSANRSALVQLSEEDSEPVFARFIAVDSIELDDTAGTWIQAFPYVEYDHPIHGKIKMDRARAERMAANVMSNVRGQDLDIDYDHKALRGDAAGWIKKAEARNDGLYIFVDWTKEALTKLKEKAYRYFSPEYVDKWKHPGGQVFTDVLFGGALTNRPFLKGITPINLSEMVGLSEGQGAPRTEGGNQVNREQLEQLAGNLGVEFTDEMSDEDLFTAIAEASTQEETEESEESETQEEEEENEQETEAIAASEEQLKKLAETNPAVALLLRNRERQEKRLAALETSNRLSEVKIKLAEIGNDKAQLAPKYRDKVKALAIKLSDTASDELIELVKGIVNDGIVELGERGGRSGGGNDAHDDGTVFDNKVKALMESNEDLSLGDALEMVALEDPELFTQYRRSSYANDELRGN